MPDLPNLEQYFKSQSKGKHPFEEDAYRFDEDEDLKR